MNRLNTIIIFICLGFISASANDIARNGEIDEQITRFWKHISNINDTDEESIGKYFGYIVKYYERSDDRLTFNSDRIGMFNFLKNYRYKVLQNNNITQSFQRTEIKNYPENEDHLFFVTGILNREILQNKEDFLIKPITVKMLVYYNKEANKDNTVKILEIKMNQNLDKVYPKFRDEYELKVIPSKTHIGYAAEDVTISIFSKKRTIKSYPGIDDIGKIVDSTFVRVTGTADYAKLYQINESKYKASFRDNFSTSSQSYVISFKQEDGGLTRDVHITQSFQYSPNKLKMFFEFDGAYYNPLWNISLHYSPKYNLGLSIMFTPEESRFSFGGIISSNFDSFRDLYSNYEISYSKSISQSNVIVNGYKITSEVLNPEENDYSSIFDPYNEAKHYKSRTIIMANLGYHLTNWCNISLGIGPIIYRDLHFMETTYDVTRTSYTPMQSGLPTIADIYTHSRHISPHNYYFKSPTTWDLGLRPAINFSIPLGEDVYMPIGCGYVISTLGKLKDCNSFDFNIGISFNY